MDPPFSSQSSSLSRLLSLPFPDMMGHLVGKCFCMAEAALKWPSPPFSALLQLPGMGPLATSCGPFGTSPVPRLCCEPRAGLLPCRSTTVVSIQTPVVFSPVLCHLSSFILGLSTVCSHPAPRRPLPTDALVVKHHSGTVPYLLAGDWHAAST